MLVPTEPATPVQWSRGHPRAGNGLVIKAKRTMISLSISCVWIHTQWESTFLILKYISRRHMLIWIKTVWWSFSSLNLPSTSPCITLMAVKLQSQCKHECVLFLLRYFQVVSLTVIVFDFSKSHPFYGRKGKVGPGWTLLTTYHVPWRACRILDLWGYIHSFRDTQW